MLLLCEIYTHLLYFSLQNREKECDPDKDYSLSAAMSEMRSKFGKTEKDTQMGEWKKMRL